MKKEEINKVMLKNKNVARAMEKAYQVNWEFSGNIEEVYKEGYKDGYKAGFDEAIYLMKYFIENGKAPDGCGYKQGRQ